MSLQPGFYFGETMRKTSFSRLVASVSLQVVLSSLCPPNY